MISALKVLGVVLIAAGLTYHFAAAATFNLLVPKDAGSTQVASGVAYGPDPRQRFDVYAPAAPGPHPVLLFAYGGSWNSGRKANFAFVGRAFAAQGFVTVIPDYRLAPAAHYPDFVDDIAEAAAAALRAAPTFGGDPSRLFFMGHSAGGYNVLQAALLPGLLEAHGVPKGTLKAVVTLAAPADFKPLDFPETRAAFGQYPDLGATLPVSHARPDAPPLLMLHGRYDTTVGLYNAEHMMRAMAEKGGHAEMKVYEHLAHLGIIMAIARPFRAWAPVLQDSVDFFQRYDSTMGHASS